MTGKRSASRLRFTTKARRWVTKSKPARMYEVKGDLDASGIYLDEEVRQFCRVYFKPRQRQTVQDHKEMNAALDPAVTRFRELWEEDEDRAETPSWDRFQAFPQPLRVF